MGSYLRPPNHKPRQSTGEAAWVAWITCRVLIAGLLDGGSRRVNLPAAEVRSPALWCRVWMGGVSALGKADNNFHWLSRLFR